MVQPNKSFSEALFDFSFSSFVTLKVVGILYGLAIVLAVLVGILAIISALTQGVLQFLLSLILAPIGVFFYVLGARIGLEALIASIRTAENTTRLVQSQQSIP